MSATTSSQGEFAIVPIKEKVAYCFAIVAMAVYYFLILSLCIFFFTDVAGIPATTIGVLVMVSRCFDGVSDLIAGAIIDNTKSRFGKAQAWMIRFIVPTSAFMILMYCIPKGLSPAGQIAYFLVTYNLTVTVGFTMSNTALMTLASMMTRDQGQRSTLFSLMMCFSPVGSAIGVAITLPMVAFFGNDQHAWIVTMVILGVIGSIIMIVSALICKERVHEEKEVKVPGLTKKRFIAVVTNSQWWIMVGITCMYSVFLVGFSTMMTYFSTYFIGDLQFTSLLNSVQSYLMAGVSLLMIVLTKRFKKSTLVRFGMILVIPGQIIMNMGVTNRLLLFVGLIIRSFGFGLLGTAMYIMVSDCIEYVHWRSGVRADAMVTSSSAFGNKFGVFFSGGLFPLLMGLAGYDGTLQVQSASAMSMIRFLFIWSPLIAAGIVLVLLMFYRIDKDYDTAIEDLSHGRFHPKARFVGVDDAVVSSIEGDDTSVPATAANS